jgi:hypothetical protein
MPKFKDYLLALSATLVATTNANVTGRVLENANGEMPLVSDSSALIGAVVQQLGSTDSTMTDSTGAFSLSVLGDISPTLKASEPDVKIENGVLSLQIFNKGMLNVQLFSIQGNEIASYSGEVSESIKTISLFENQKLKDGMFILKIQMDDATYIQKIGVSRGQLGNSIAAQPVKLSSFGKQIASASKSIEFSLPGYESKTLVITSDTLDLGDVLLDRIINQVGLSYSDYYKMSPQENYLIVDSYDSLNNYNLLLEGNDTKDSFVFSIDSVTMGVDSLGVDYYKYWWGNDSTFDLKSDVYNAQLQVENNERLTWEVKQEGDSTIAQIVYPNGSDYFDAIKSMGNFHPGLNAWLVWSRNNLDIDLLEGVTDYSGALHFYTVTGTTSLGSVPARSAFGNGVNFGTIRCSPPTFLPKKGHYRVRYIGRTGEKTPFVNIYFQYN